MHSIAGCQLLVIVGPDLRRLLEHITIRRVGFCVVVTRDRLSEDNEHVVNIDDGPGRPRWALVIAAGHTGPTAN